MGSDRNSLLRGTHHLEVGREGAIQQSLQYCLRVTIELSQTCLHTHTHTHTGNVKLLFANSFQTLGQVSD